MAFSKYNAGDLENDFADLYCGMIPKIYDMKSHEFMRAVRNAVKDIRQLKQDIDKTDKLFFADVQFQKPQYRCAYLYVYSLLHTAIVHHHFTNYVKINRNTVLSYFKENKVKIVCLGGGPGIEGVSMCKVINDLFLEISTLEKYNYLEIYVAVIDICEKWEHEVLSIVEALNKHTSILDSNKIKLHVKFIQANLLEPFDPNVQEEISNANIVSMVKLASAILERTPYKPNDKLQNMIKRVADCMGKDSCLFFLDNAGGGVFSSLIHCLSISSYSIFEKKEHEKHTLNIRALQKMEKLIRFEKNTPFSLCIPTRITTVSSCFCIEEGQSEETVGDKVDTSPSVTIDNSCQLEPGNVQIGKSTPTTKLNKKKSKSCSATTKVKTNSVPSKKKSSKKDQSNPSTVLQDQIDIKQPKQKSSKKDQSDPPTVVQDQIDIKQPKQKSSKKDQSEVKQN